MNSCLPAIVAVLVLTAACSNPSSQSSQAGSGGGPAEVLHVHTASGVYSSVFPAKLKVFNGQAPGIELSIEAGRQPESWLAFAKLPRQQTIAGSGTVSLKTDPTVEGTGMLKLAGPDAGVEAAATSGTLQFTVVKGTLTGDVHGASPQLDATFQGAVVVECWVPSSDLPPSSVGGLTPDPGYSEPLALDGKFVTPQCAPFEQLTP